MQRRALAHAFGCARVVYNDGLRLRQDAHKAGLPLIGDTELQHRVLTLAERTPERAWLRDVSAVILQQSLADLSRAYRNWFADLTRIKAARARGERAKLKVRKPRFKSRHHDQAVRFTRNSRFRSWTCPNCGAAHDRDLNAARNILAAGLAVAAGGGHVRPGAIPAAAIEAGTISAGAA
jgi:transposase